MDIIAGFDKNESIYSGLGSSMLIDSNNHNKNPILGQKKHLLKKLDSDCSTPNTIVTVLNSENRQVSTSNPKRTLDYKFQDYSQQPTRKKIHADNLQMIKMNQLKKILNTKTGQELNEKLHQQNIFQKKKASIAHREEFLS